MTGCVVLDTTLVNPDTGGPEKCTATGFGYIGAPLAIMMQEDCKKTLKGKGYITPEDFAKSGKKVVTSTLTVKSTPDGATIYSGKVKGDVVNRIGVTPYTVTVYTSAWSEECYRVELEGYDNVDTQCFQVSTGGRDVVFDLKKTTTPDSIVKNEQ